MPTGIATSSHRMAPPNTSAAVTGAAWAMIEFTLWRLPYE